MNATPSATTCEKVSPGCANCYASRLQSRFGMPPFNEQRAARRDGRVRPFLDRAVLEKVLRRRKPARIFWCDMTDLFGPWVPDEWIDAMFATMALTPQHTHLVLTKRIDRAREYLSRTKGPENVLTRVIHVAQETEKPRWWRLPAFTWPLPNVHLGVSVEDQATADARIPLLLQTPGAVRFVSYEPALGPVDFQRFRADPLRLVDWIIVGGESGVNARPCDVAWIRSVVAQGGAMGVPVFVKQLGSVPWDRTMNIGYAPGVKVDGYNVRAHLKSRKGGDPTEWPESLRVRELPA